MKLIRIYRYGDNAYITTIDSEFLADWCAKNAMLPHHKCLRGWVVIRAAN